MGIFSRRRDPKPEVGKLASATYDDQWFAGYWDDIFRIARVPDDGQNRMQLVMATLKVLDDQASNWFSQIGDPHAPAQYGLLLGRSASIGERTAFLLSWNPAIPNLMRQKFETFHGIFVRAGQSHGKFRFFPSPCCGQPIELDLQTGVSACSRCGNPRDIYSSR